MNLSDYRDRPHGPSAVESDLVGVLIGLAIFPIDKLPVIYARLPGHGLGLPPRHGVHRHAPAGGRLPMPQRRAICSIRLGSGADGRGPDGADGGPARKSWRTGGGPCRCYLQQIDPRERSGTSTWRSPCLSEQRAPADRQFRLHRRGCRPPNAFAVQRRDLSAEMAQGTGPTIAPTAAISTLTRSSSGGARQGQGDVAVKNKSRWLS
jgi:hypothetical protein